MGPPPGRTLMSVRDFAALERILQSQILSPSSDEPLPVEMEEESKGMAW